MALDFNSDIILKNIIMFTNIKIETVMFSSKTDKAINAFYSISIDTSVSTLKVVFVSNDTRESQKRLPKIRAN